MLFLAGAALSLVVGLAAGGRIARLGQLRLSWWWLALVAFAIQMLAVYGPGVGNDAVALVLIHGANVALLALLMRNVRHPAYIVAALGLAMNVGVMLANGGFMPVAPETLARSGRVEASKVGDGLVGSRVIGSKDVILDAADTKLELLADRFHTGLPGRFNILFSLGDVVLLAGLCAFLIRSLTDPTLDGSHDQPSREATDSTLRAAPARPS